MSVEAAAAWFFAYQYFIIIPLVFFEGSMATIIGGLLVRLGHAGFGPMYLTLMMGDLAADVCWYFVGAHGARKFARRYGKYFNVTEELLAKTELTFQRHYGKILFFSKITMGFGFAVAVLMTAGLARVPFKKYIALNAAGQVIWTGFLMGVGYFFGNFYLTIEKDFRRVVLAAFIVLVFAAFYGLSKYLQRKDLQNQL